MRSPSTSRPQALFEHGRKRDEKPVAHGPLARPENLASLARLNTRFHEFVDYASTFLNHSSNSTSWYARCFANYRKYVSEGLALPPDEFEARARAIEEWVRWNRRAGTMSDITINNYWRGLRVFFKDVEARDGLESPFAKTKAPGFRDAAPKALEEVACARILAAADSYPWPAPYREYKRMLGVAVVAVMLYAGLRRAEVVKLQYVDLQEKTIRIVGGKGKCGGRDRVAYVSPDLKRILIAFLQERRRAGIVQPELFVSLRSKQGITLVMLRRLLEKLSRAAGVRFSAHMLRHSFVTHLLHSGVDLHLVRDLAGHRQISTTLNYLRVFDEDLEQAITRLKYRPDGNRGR